MNKIFFLILAFFALSCDDGDIFFQDSTFETEELKSCNLVTADNFYLFKSEGDKSLILQLGLNANTIFKGQITPANSPRLLTLTSNIKLTERIYNRSLGNNDICTILPPTNLQIIKEWQSESGTIEVRTTAIKQEANANNETRLLRYRHTIVVKDLTINRDGQLQTFDNFEVGFYEQNAEAFPSFNATNNIVKCPNTDRYILNTTNRIFELNVPSALFTNVDTPVNEPRIALIDATHKFIYRIYPQIFSDAQRCDLPSQTATEIWEAENGINNVSGIIEVTTTSAPDPNMPTVTVFTHQVKLRKLKMKRTIPNDGVDFLLGDEIILGIYRNEQ